MKSARLTLLAIAAVGLSACSAEHGSSAFPGLPEVYSTHHARPGTTSPTMRLYVAAGATSSSGTGQILSFDWPPSTANETPHQDITGANTDLVAWPLSVALGPSNYIFATQDVLNPLDNFYKVPQFQPSANGNATPNLVVSTKSQAVVAQGVTVDASGDLWVVGRGSYGAGTSAVLEYAKNASGDATPIDVISGPKTGLYEPMSIALDPAGDIWVANFSCCSSGSPTSILEFAPSASGNASPMVTIAGSKTDLDNPWQVAIDSSTYGGDRIIVADLNSGIAGAVLVFAPGSSGNVKPVAVITSVQGPGGVVTDSSGHIYVSSQTNNAIHEFARNANGNATPIYSVHGSNTNLHAPNNLALRYL
jgi:hypothetical protein